MCSITLNRNISKNWPATGRHKCYLKKKSVWKENGAVQYWASQNKNEKTNLIYRNHLGVNEKQEKRRHATVKRLHITRTAQHNPLNEWHLEKNADECVVCCWVTCDAERSGGGGGGKHTRCACVCMCLFVRVMWCAVHMLSERERERCFASKSCLRLWSHGLMEFLVSFFQYRSINGDEVHHIHCGQYRRLCISLWMNEY